MLSGFFSLRLDWIEGNLGNSKERKDAVSVEIE